MILVDLAVASKRSTVQTLGLIFQKDVDEFGLENCLSPIISELNELVSEGISDERTKNILQVRVVANLGDNLEQVEICGLLKNFGSMEHCCRKCKCSKTDMKRADHYFQIHAKNHEERTDKSLYEDFLESQEKEVKHINGVGNKSLYHEFPFFDSSKMLPQCSSHDLLEGCAKLWLKIILEHFVQMKWFSWDAFERIVKSFPYRGSDSNSRLTFSAKKMKVKHSRRIVGTFAEISTLIRTLPQLLFDQIQDPTDDYWKWFLKVQKVISQFAIGGNNKFQIFSKLKVMKIKIGADFLFSNTVQQQVVFPLEET